MKSVNWYDLLKNIDKNTYMWLEHFLKIETNAISLIATLKNKKIEIVQILSKNKFRIDILIWQYIW